MKPTEICDGDAYYREGLRWAKVGKIRDREWIAALGWKNQTTAIRLYRCSTKRSATAWALDWLTDQ